MKKLRHTEMKHLAQGHSENKWWNMNSIQKVGLQSLHFAASSHYAVVSPENLMQLLEPRPTPYAFFRYLIESRSQNWKGPRRGSLLIVGTPGEDILRTKSVFLKECHAYYWRCARWLWICMSKRFHIHSYVYLKYASDRHYANMHYDKIFCVIILVFNFEKYQKYITGEIML